MNYWVIDFEASGLNKVSYPIEVGITNGVVEYKALIKPMAHWISWDASAERVHGISKKDLIDIGFEAVQVVNRMNDLIGFNEIYCDNVRWDKFWLNVLFSDNCISPSFEIRDVQDIIKTENQWKRYEFKKKEIENKGLYRKHRALDDARVIHESLLYSMI